METGWPFNDPPNLAVITTRSIVEDGVPILRVTHDEDDGGWQFLDGQIVNEDEARIVSLHYIVSLDPTLTQLASLSLGTAAQRQSPDQQWQLLKD